MATQLIEVSIGESRRMFVEIEDSRTGRAGAVARADLIAKAKQTFEEIVAQVAEIVQPLRDSLQKQATDASEIKVELGIKLSTELGLIVAKSQAEGNFKISISWKK